MLLLSPNPFSDRFLQALGDECRRLCEEKLPVRRKGEKPEAYEARFRAAQIKPLLMARTLDALIEFEKEAERDATALLSHQAKLFDRFSLPEAQDAREKLLNRTVALVTAPKARKAPGTPQTFLSTTIPGDPVLIGVQNKGIDPSAPAVARPAVVRHDLQERIRDLFPVKKDS